jgi:hypothetical protein
MADRVKRTVTIHPFVDFLIREVWQSGIQLGWPRTSYSKGIEAALMLFYYELVPPHRMPRREAVESALRFIQGKTAITQKDRQMLHEYVQDFVATRAVAVSRTLPSRDGATTEDGASGSPET